MTHDEQRAAVRASLQGQPRDVYPVREPVPAIGPTMPAIIAWRFACWSCGVPAGEPCKLPSGADQRLSHESRHRAARAHSWRRDMRDVHPAVRNVIR